MYTFTRNEIRDLIIAFIVISVAFAISNVGLNIHGFISILPIVMIGAGIGCLSHELGHKYVAMKYGYQSEFKAWPLGLVIALVTAFIGWVFAAPGSTQVYADDISDEMNGKIAIAGPMANMTLALLFLLIATVAYYLTDFSLIFTLIYLIGAVGFSVNSFLATFNLLPLYSLDGTKILKWNIKYWILIFAVAVIMLLASISIGAENMVKYIISMSIIK